MTEIFRVTKKYIWGFEYFSNNCGEISYRGHKNCLWENDFCGIFLKEFPELRLSKREKFKRLDNSKLDEMYLFKK